MNMTPSQAVENLCQHLQIASTRLSAVNGPIWSSYDSGAGIAQFIVNCLNGIRAGTLTLEQKKELWGIFAPTSDWDDVVGDPHLGETVFQLLNDLYWQDIQSQ